MGTGYRDLRREAALRQAAAFGARSGEAPAERGLRLHGRHPWNKDLSTSAHGGHAWQTDYAWGCCVAALDVLRAAYPDGPPGISWVAAGKGRREYGCRAVCAGSSRADLRALGAQGVVVHEGEHEYEYLLVLEQTCYDPAIPYRIVPPAASPAGQALTQYGRVFREALLAAFGAQRAENAATAAVHLAAEAAETAVIDARGDSDPAIVAARAQYPDWQSWPWRDDWRARRDGWAIAGYRAGHGRRAEEWHHLRTTESGGHGEYTASTWAARVVLPVEGHGEFAGECWRGADPDHRTD